MKTLHIVVFLLVLLCGCLNQDVTDPKCDALTDQSLMDGCYQEDGIITNDPRYCEKISGSDFRDRCFFQIAVDRSWPGLCRNVAKENDENHCYAVTSGNDSFCAKVDLTDRRDKCYYDVGLRKHLSSCARINDSFLRDNCVVRYVYDTGNLSACEKVESTGRKEKCYYTLAERGDRSDPAACDNIPVKEYKDDCYIMIVENTRDKALCEKIDSKDTRNYCFGLTNTDPSYCERIVSGNLSEDCFFQLSKIIPESIDCTRMNDTDNRDFCYSSQAEYANDSSACSMIVDENIMNLCYAYKEKDISYCNRIQGIEYAQECRDDLTRIRNSTEI